MRLSIIIPVYNVAEYIATCLDSVLEQDIPYSDYEVIVVNDGSPDESATIIERYVDNYPNIKYIVKQNGGPSSARNTGLDRATGRYIWFVDGDDTIAPMCLGGLLDYAEEMDLDFCEFGYNEDWSGIQHLKDINFHISNRVIDNSEFIHCCTIPTTPWKYICSRNLFSINRLKFIEGIFHEDLELNIRILAHCSRISYYSSSMGLYNYVINREGSTMTNPDLAHTYKRINSYVFILHKIERQFPINNDRKDYSYYIHRYANDILPHFLIPLIENSAIQDKQTFFRRIVNDNHLSYNLEVEVGREKIKLWLLSLVKSNYRMTKSLLQSFDKLGRIRKSM